MSVGAVVADHQEMPVDDRVRKARETFLARAALEGVQLARMADGTWLASKWGMFKTLQDDQAVDTWLSRIEGRAG